jgi:hypothetical protein
VDHAGYFCKDRELAITVEVAWGLLYDITDADLREAERLSRVQEGRYTRRDFDVLGEDGKRYKGIAYVIKHPLGPSKPSHEYLNHMLKGGKEFGFPPAFVDALKALGG